MERTKWLEFTELWLQVQQRACEHDNRGQLSRLGLTIELKELSRTAHYRVASLARLCGVCERTLEREMKAAYHTTACSWLRTLQVFDSIALICEARPIKQVAGQMYFDDAAHFSRVFKRVTHYTPKDFRRDWMRNGQPPLC